MKSKINIIGITDGSYPYGGATTVRNLALFKGLKELDYNVLLLSIYPDKNQDKLSSLHDGIYDKVPFKYTCKNLKYHKNKVVHLVYLIISLLKALAYIFKNYQSSDTVIINFIPNPSISFIFTYVLTNRNYIVFHEVTEFPFLRSFNSFISNYIYFKLSVPRFHKIFVITNALKEFYSQYVPSEKIEILNMVVDNNRFSIKQDPVYNFNYIAYCGMMNTDKDGVSMLIESFSMVLKKHPNLKLVLIGDTKKRPIHKKIKESIEKNKLNNKVIFTGHINNHDIPKYLQYAKILALARPDNIQAKGGFPTKLGEYLATGKPVIVTRVGEIPFFIKDGQNGFLSEPNTVDFSNKIISIIENYNTALIVGERGKNLVQNEFSYLNEATKISTAINKIIKT